MRASWHLVALAAACTLALAACDGPPNSSARIVPGSTGSGTADASGGRPAAQPGVGLNGGLGTSMGAASAAGADGGGAVPLPEGSANTSPRTAVGTRP